MNLNLRAWAMCLMLWLTPSWAIAQSPDPDGVRFAVFNVQELSAEKIDRVDARGRGADPQLIHAARVIEHLDPDVLVLLEIDFDAERRLLDLFLERYLGKTAHAYGQRVYLPVNTGVPSTLDLNNDGDAGDPEDAWGYGRYPGQYGMAVASRLPIERSKIRTFQGLRWVSLPNHLMPDGRQDRPAWYPPETAGLLRLSSKSHWDVPIEVQGHIVHLLVSHPTPPVFDGEEDRNGRRNHDEIRLWADYISGGDRAAYLLDDAGVRGGLAENDFFVIAGDLNADPHRPGPLGPPTIRQLLDHPRIHDPVPKTEGEQPTDRTYEGDGRTRTSAYGRLDYMLPSRNLRVLGTGIFLPPEGDPRRAWVVGETGAGDHQMVWLDLSTKGTR